MDCVARIKEDMLVNDLQAQAELVKLQTQYPQYSKALSGLQVGGSNHDMVVLVNPNTKQSFTAFRGSDLKTDPTNLRDLTNDASIFLTGNTFRRGDTSSKEYVARAVSRSLELTAHSLSLTI